MKIAMVSEHASPLALLGGADAGGQNVHVGALANELVRQGHHVVVHTRRDDPALDRRVVMTGGAVIDHVDAGPAAPMAKDRLLPYMTQFADDLAAQWEADRPDVVHAHFWMSGFATARAATSLHLPWVQTFHALGAVKRRHQGADDTSPSQRLAIEESLVAQADRLVATCVDEALELLRLGASSPQIAVIPCGVDLDLFGPDGAVAPGRAGLRRLLVMGRLVERKGIGDVIAVLADLPDVELCIAGGPAPADLDGDEDVRRLRKIAVRHGVADRVAMLGRVARAELPALVRSADAVVSVPYYEPFGMVALEAMACGVPVVVSSVGGLAETVLDEVTGLQVPPQDPAALTRALRRLLDDAGLAGHLGREGMRVARHRYGWASVADATLDVYAQLVREQAEAKVKP